MTDGRRQIDTEKQAALVLSLFPSTGFRLASEPRQTLVIIPCQLGFLPFVLSVLLSFSFLSVVVKAEARLSANCQP